MNRLQSEHHRLFEVPPASLADGQVRATVLTLARPADWTALSTVWRGVQADLALPAPAIAVNGVDGYALWFSLATPTPAAIALAFVTALCARYLGDIGGARLDLRTDFDALPPRPTQDGQWSAFVAADLAPIFAAEPWLDIPPSPEGQADVLCRLESINDAALQAALAGLGGTATTIPAAAGSGAPPADGADLDPTRFLHDVLKDRTVALALRIEAAKALLMR